MRTSVVKQLWTIALGLLLLVSCGYKFPTGDTHPDMPEFPSMSNPNFRVETVERLRIDRLDYANGRFYSSCREVGPDDDTEYFTAIFDNRFNELVRLPDEPFVVDSMGNLYMSDENSLAVYRTPRFNKELLPVYPISFDSIYQNYISRLSTEDSIRADTSYEFRKELHISFEDSARAKICQGIECYAYVPAPKWDLVQKRGLKYAISGNVRFHWNEDVTECREFRSTTYARDANVQRKYVPNLNLELTDESVLGNNTGGGNHFVPGYVRPYGYGYYELNVEGELASFKYMQKERPNNNWVHQLSEFDGHKLLIMTGDNSLHWVYVD